MALGSVEMSQESTVVKTWESLSLRVITSQSWGCDVILSLCPVRVMVPWGVGGREKNTPSLRWDGALRDGSNQSSTQITESEWECLGYVSSLELTLDLWLLLQVRVISQWLPWPIQPENRILLFFWPLNAYVYHTQPGGKKGGASWMMMDIPLDRMRAESVPSTPQG